MVDFITKKKLETILYNTIISDPVLSQMTVKDLKLNRDQNVFWNEILYIALVDFIE